MHRIIMQVFHLTGTEVQVLELFAVWVTVLDMFWIEKASKALRDLAALLENFAQKSKTVETILCDTAEQTEALPAV